VGLLDYSVQQRLRDYLSEAFRGCDEMALRTTPLGRLGVRDPPLVLELLQDIFGEGLRVKGCVGVCISASRRTSAALKGAEPVMVASANKNAR
jgi:hypothetical protein